MSRILSGLMSIGDSSMGRGAQLLDSASGRWLQNQQFLADFAERRRRALRDEQLQQEAIDNQKEANDQARSDGWWKFGISTAAPVAAGGIAGGITDMATSAPGAASGPYSVPAPVGGAPDVPMPSAIMPTGGGGSFGRGFALGSLGGLTGQDYLGSVREWPYKSAIYQGRINNAASRDAVNTSIAGLNDARRATEDELRQPRVDTETARGGSYDALTRTRDADTRQTNTLTPLKASTERARAGAQTSLAGSYDALAGVRNEQGQTLRDKRPLELGEIESRTDENYAQAGAADARAGLYGEQAQTATDQRPLSLDVMRARIRNLNARTAATGAAAAGGGEPKPSKGMLELDARLDDMAARKASDKEFRSLLETAKKNHLINQAEYDRRMRELFGE